MKIVNDYNGSSINIDKIDFSNNKAYLSLVEENNKASHYFNFLAINESDMPGTAVITNFNKSAYYSSNSFSPYKNINHTWIRMNDSEYTIEDNSITFSISANSTIEISLVPRYTENDLINFCKKSNIVFSDSTLIKIDLGDIEKPTVFIIGRQHPGETLSSFFIEGIIQEIQANEYLKNNYHFLLYPIVNRNGVENGDHRYSDGIDFNRSWNTPAPPSEIYCIKSELQQYKDLKYFIDIHNDEITPNDYIRMTHPQKKTIGNIQVLESMSNFKRFLRALIKQRKIIDLNQKTAREYVEKEYSCQGILVELSMNDNFESLNEQGKVFIDDLCNSSIQS